MKINHVSDMKKYVGKITELRHGPDGEVCGTLRTPLNFEMRFDDCGILPALARRLRVGDDVVFEAMSHSDTVVYMVLGFARDVAPLTPLRDAPRVAPFAAALATCALCLLAILANESGLTPLPRLITTAWASP